jgi:group II intron reverse transcriptase/maturase
MRCRENDILSKPSGLFCRGISAAETCLLAAWQASYRRHEVYSGLVMEQRKSYKNAKGKAQAGETLVRPNTDVLYEFGLSHSSDEAPVMGVERRAEVTQLRLPLSTSRKRGRGSRAETKSIPIAKKMVMAAYKKVRSNKGAAGIDDETIEMYKEHLEDNLYILWNRMSSGSYFPVSVLEVEILKDDGKRKRKLGIPTVNDRVAQQVIKSYLEPRFEALFSLKSYGYRPLKCAHQAVEQVRKNVRRYHWVIDMDISGFFDNMSHELLQKAVERHVKEKWAKMYITRWLQATIEDRKGNKRQRDGKGTPQGGVISPLLSNLFLHYAFGRWFEITYPALTFVRYADDLVVHCNSQREAEEVLEAIKKRLGECRLELNEQKTKIVYCKKDHRKEKYKPVKFDFLGFGFQPRPSLTKEGEIFLGFDCAISRKSEHKIAEIIRKTRFHRRTDLSIYHIAEFFNPKIRGWLNYYGKFRMNMLMRIFRIFNWRLIKWAARKYKRFKRSMYKAGDWLRNLAKCYPGLFIHWQYGFGIA